MTVPVASSVPVRFRGWARRDAAAFYLTELAKGILSGELSVRSGQNEVAVVTAEFMTLDIEARQVRLGDAHARVPHRHLDHSPRVHAPLHGDLAALGRVLDRIVHEIDEN